MVDRDVFDRRLARLEELVAELRQLGRMPRHEYLRDARARAAAERWLQLAAECALDVAHHLIADRGWKTPETYREAFAVLQAEGVLAADTSGRMQAWAGLRNVLAHLYLDVDHERIHDVVAGELDDLVRFAAEVARSVDGA